VSQVIEHLLSKYEALSSKPQYCQRKKEGREEGKEGEGGWGGRGKGKGKEKERKKEMEVRDITTDPS
jgi:hypothetical protein